MQEPRYKRLRRWMSDRDITFRAIGEQLGMSAAGARILLVKETIWKNGHYATLLRLGFPKELAAVPLVQTRDTVIAAQITAFPRELQNGNMENAANGKQSPGTAAVTQDKKGFSASQDEQIRILCQHAVKYAPNGISASCAWPRRWACANASTRCRSCRRSSGHELGGGGDRPAHHAGHGQRSAHASSRPGRWAVVVPRELPLVLLRAATAAEDPLASLVESVRQNRRASAAQAAQSLDDGIITGRGTGPASRRGGQMALSAILRVMELSDRAHPRPK